MCGEKQCCIWYMMRFFLFFFFKNNTDSEGREFETRYEKMRWWRTVGCQLDCSATERRSAVTHRFLPSSILPPPAWSREEKNKKIKPEATITRTITASYFHVLIFLPSLSLSVLHYFPRSVMCSVESSSKAGRAGPSLNSGKSHVFYDICQI